MSFWSTLFRQPKTGFILALGAGGGRGLAHIGVLLALEEEGLRPDALVGSSVGALLATMYAQQPDVMHMQQCILTFLKSKDFQRLNSTVFHPLSDKINSSWLERLSAVARQSVLYGRAMTSNAIADQQVLAFILKQLHITHAFSDLKIPVHMLATRFPQGQVTMFSSGKLHTCLAASMAIPTIFPPVQMDGQRYVDGGVYAEVPAIQAKSMATNQQCVLAVNVGARRLAMHDPVNVLGVLDWVIDAQAQQLRERDIAAADILISPPVHHRLWYDFTQPESCIEAGYHAMKQHMPKLRAILS